MRPIHAKVLAFAFLLPIIPLKSALAQAQVEKVSYPVRAPLAQYLTQDEHAEIALARSAAPASVSDAAEVMVLRADGYATAVPGSNGFVCLVERSWGSTTDDPQFWNPKVRAPHCFNAPAAQTFLPVFLMKSKLVIAGKSRAEIGAAVASAVKKNEFPAIAPGTLVYMMSKRQYLNDSVHSWHPHVMFFAAGDAAKSWEPNPPDSPVMAAYDPEQQATTFFVLTAYWSDGTPGPPMAP